MREFADKGGEGVQKSENVADVINGSPLMRMQYYVPLSPTRSPAKKASHSQQLVTLWSIPRAGYGDFRVLPEVRAVHAVRGIRDGLTRDDFETS